MKSTEEAAIELAEHVLRITAELDDPIVMLGILETLKFRVATLYDSFMVPDMNTK